MQYEIIKSDNIYTGNNIKQYIKKFKNIQLRIAKQVLMSGTGREEKFEQLVMPLSSTDYL